MLIGVSHKLVSYKQPRMRIYLSTSWLILSESAEVRIYEVRMAYVNIAHYWSLQLLSW